MNKSIRPFNLGRFTRFLICLQLLFISQSGWAKDSFTIQQKHHRFSELFIKIKNNDVIKFINLDSVNHRLVFSHKGRQEQMNAIKPGDSQEITFSQSGIYDVQCKHHPEMKLTIFIPYDLKLTKDKAIYAF